MEGGGEGIRGVGGILAKVFIIYKDIASNVFEKLYCKLLFFLYSPASPSSLFFGV